MHKLNRGMKDIRKQNCVNSIYLLYISLILHRLNTAVIITQHRNRFTPKEWLLLLKSNLSARHRAFFCIRRTVWGKKISICSGQLKKYMLTLRPYLKELMKKGHYAPTLCSRPQALCLSIFVNAWHTCCTSAPFFRLTECWQNGETLEVKSGNSSISNLKNRLYSTFSLGLFFVNGLYGS